MKVELIITHVEHVAMGPQNPPVMSASMRCYRVQKSDDSDGIAAFESFHIPTRTFGRTLLPIGTEMMTEYPEEIRASEFGT